MKPVQKKYDTSEEIFYKVYADMWALCSKYLPQFAEFKASYTPAYIKTAMKALADAQKCVTGGEAIRHIKETRIELTQAARQVLDNWQALKLYIINAYTTEYTDAHLAMAGGALYKKALCNNWNSLGSLLRMGSHFINLKTDELIRKQNMPNHFPSQFKAAGAAFKQIETSFFKARVQQSVITNKRLTANNRAYDLLSKMIRDAGHIFRQQPAIKKQFIFRNAVSAYENKNTGGITIPAIYKKPLPQIITTTIEGRNVNNAQAAAVKKVA